MRESDKKLLKTIAVFNIIYIIMLLAFNVFLLLEIFGVRVDFFYQQLTQYIDAKNFKTYINFLFLYVFIIIALNAYLAKLYITLANTKVIIVNLRQILSSVLVGQILIGCNVISMILLIILIVRLGKVEPRNIEIPAEQPQKKNSLDIMKEQIELLKNELANGTITQEKYDIELKLIIDRNIESD